jgi:hypothetical protein
MSLESLRDFRKWPIVPPSRLFVTLKGFLGWRTAHLPRPHVGFDTSDLYFDMLLSSRLQGLVAQDPYRMGELAVKTLVDHLRGKSVPRRVDTGATMVTPANMDAPEIAQLLQHSGAPK